MTTNRPDCRSRRPTRLAVGVRRARPRQMMTNNLHEARYHHRAEPGSGRSIHPDRRPSLPTRRQAGVALTR